MAARVSASRETPAFLAACLRQPVPYRPIWIMRQAGRYLPEYRALRAKVNFEALTRTPDLAAEVTLQPLRRFELDAAILFSDIMTPLQGMGVDLAFEPGPVVREPIRTDAQIEALPALVPQRDVPFVLETIRLVRANMPRLAPLVGFAGAQALMLFESWAGLLAPREFQRFALRAVRRTMAGLRGTGVPLIYYVNQGSALMESVADLDVDVIGVDWRSPLGAVRRVLGAGKAVQGNLDPAALFAPPEELRRQAAAVLDEAGPTPGHIFNLGHGIWPETDPEAVARLVGYVHERTSVASAGGGSGAAP